MEIENLAEGSQGFTSNAFLLNEKSLVDVGADEVILERLEGKELETVVITHTHPDHIQNLEEIVSRFGPEVFAFAPGNIPVDAVALENGSKVEIAGTEFTAYHTPGHRDDHICLYSESEKILFSGDLIFPEGSFGRTDLEEGDREVLIKSIEKIEELDVEEMYPGHGEPVLEGTNGSITKSLENARRREPKY